MSGRRVLGSALRAAALALCVVLCASTAVFGEHYRYGHMYWDRHPESTNATHMQATVTLDTVWARDGLPTPNNVGNSVAMGDLTLSGTGCTLVTCPAIPISGPILVIEPVYNLAFVRWTRRFAYPKTAQPLTVSWFSDWRWESIRANAWSQIHLFVYISAGKGRNRSPRSAMVPFAWFQWSTSWSDTMPIIVFDGAIPAMRYPDYSTEPDLYDINNSLMTLTGRDKLTALNDFGDGDILLSSYWVLQALDPLSNNTVLMESPIEWITWGWGYDHIGPDWRKPYPRVDILFRQKTYTISPGQTTTFNVTVTITRPTGYALRVTPTFLAPGMTAVGGNCPYVAGRNSCNLTISMTPVINPGYWQNSYTPHVLCFQAYATGGPNGTVPAMVNGTNALPCVKLLPIEQDNVVALTTPADHTCGTPNALSGSVWGGYPSQGLVPQFNRLLMFYGNSANTTEDRGIRKGKLLCYTYTYEGDVPAWQYGMGNCSYAVGDLFPDSGLAITAYAPVRPGEFSARNATKSITVSQGQLASTVQLRCDPYFPVYNGPNHIVNGSSRCTQTWEGVGTAIPQDGSVLRIRLQNALTTPPTIFFEKNYTLALSSNPSLRAFVWNFSIPDAGLTTAWQTEWYMTGTTCVRGPATQNPRTQYIDNANGNARYLTKFVGDPNVATTRTVAVGSTIFFPARLVRWPLLTPAPQIMSGGGRRSIANQVVPSSNFIGQLLAVHDPATGWAGNNTNITFLTTGTWTVTVLTVVSQNDNELSEAGDISGTNIKYPYYVTVIPANSALDIITAPATTSVNVSTLLQTTLRRVTVPGSLVGNQTVTFHIVCVDTGAVADVNATSLGPADPNWGRVRLWYAFPSVATYTVQAFFGASALLYGSSSNVWTITVVPTQPTTLTVGAASGVCGATATLTGTLTITSSGSPLSGQPVTFTLLSSGATLCAGTTSGSGVATCTFTAGDGLSGATYVATYAGVANTYSSATASAAWDIAKAATALSTVSAPTGVAGVIGGTVTVSTTLTRTDSPSGVVSGAAVVFVIVPPVTSGASAVAVSVTTDASGVATYAYTVGAGVGVYSVNATYAGSSCLGASNAAGATFSVYQKTHLALTLPGSGSVVCGQSVTVSAALTAQPANTALFGQSVTFSFGSSGVSSQSATTGGGGVAEVTVTFPSGSTSFTVTASFSNPSGAFYADHTGALADETAAATQTVTSAATALATLTADHSGGVYVVGEAVTVTTTATRTSSPAGPLADGTSVSLMVMGPLSATYTATVAGGAGGVAYALPAWTAAGVYTITAAFAASSCLQSASSNTVTVTFLQRVNLTLTASGADVPCGSARDYTALLTTVPAGAAVAGQVVHFRFAGSQHVTATTNSYGVATASAVAIDRSYPSTSAVAWVDVTRPEVAALYLATRSGSTTANETSTLDIAVPSAGSALSSPSLSPSFYLVGAPVTVTSTLSRTSSPSGAVGAGQTVTLTTTWTLGSGSNVQTATTDGSGVVSFTFTPTQRGPHTFTLTYAGDACLGASSPAATSALVFQRVAVAIAPEATAVCGASASLWASLTALPSATPVGSQAVVVSYDPSCGATTQTVTTNAVTGMATATPSVTSVGSHFNTTATFLNPDEYFTNDAGAVPVNSAVAFGLLNVTAATASLALGTLMEGVVGASDWSVSATLTRTCAPTGGMGGKSIVFTVSGPGGFTASQTGTTAALTGVASVTFPAFTTRGEYTVQASFAGDACVSAKSTAAVAFAVRQHVVVFPQSVYSVCESVFNVSAVLKTTPEYAFAPAGLPVNFVLFDEVNNVSLACNGTTDAAGSAWCSLSYAAANVTGYLRAAVAAAPNQYLLAGADQTSAQIIGAFSYFSPFEVEDLDWTNHTILIRTRLTRTGSSGLEPVANYSVVRFQFLSSDLSQVNADTQHTDANGTMTLVLPIGVPGSFSMAVNYDGDACIQPAQRGLDFVVLDKVWLAVNPQESTCNAQSKITAGLSRRPDQSVPAAGITVRFAFNHTGIDGLTWQDTTSNAQGIATVTRNFAAVGTYWLNVTWDPSNQLGGYFQWAGNSDGEWKPTNIFTLLRISKAQSQFVPSLVLSSGDYALVGDDIYFATKVGRLSTPSGVGISLAQLIVYSWGPLAQNGDYSATTWDLETAYTAQYVGADYYGVVNTYYSPVDLGLWHVRAVYDGDECYEPAFADTNLKLVIRSGFESVTLRSGGVCGANTTLVARLVQLPFYAFPFSWSGENGTGLFPGSRYPQQTVPLMNIGQGFFFVTAWDSAGNYSYHLNWYHPELWSVNPTGALHEPTVYDGFVSIQHAVARVVNVTVQSETAYTGSTLTATAQLLRVSQPARWVAGATLTFTLTYPSGAGSTTTTAVTDALGTATAVFSAVDVAARGVAQVTASYAGDDCLNPATSSGSTPVTVYQRVAVAVDADTVSATCSVSSTFGATVTRYPQGTALTGQELTWSWDSALGVSGVSGTTGSDGHASVSQTFPDALAPSATAAWSLSWTAADYYTAVTGSAPANFAYTAGAVSIARLPAAGDLSIPFTVDASNTATLLYDAVVSAGGLPGFGVSGLHTTDPALPLTPYGSILHWTLTEPYSSTATELANVTIDAEGNAAWSGVIPVPTPKSGLYVVTVTWPQTSCIAALTWTLQYKVYQRTKIEWRQNAMPANAVCGVPTTPDMSVVWSNLPQAAPVSFAGVAATGVVVTFSAPTDSEGAMATPSTSEAQTLNSTGWLDLSTTFTQYGTWTANATNAVGLDAYALANEDGVSNPDPAFLWATTVVEVAPAPAAFDSWSVTPTHPLVGDALVVSALLRRDIAPFDAQTGANVTFTLTGVSGAATGVAYTIEVTTDGTGVATALFPLSVRGGYEVVAVSESHDSCVGVATSDAHSVSVYQRVAVTMDSATITSSCGAGAAPVAVVTALPGDVPLQGKTVSFAYSAESGVSAQEASTDASGAATVSPAFTVSGTFTVTGAFDGRSDFYTDATGTMPAAVSYSGAQPLAVDPAATTLVLVNLTSSALVTDTIVVSAALGAFEAVTGANITFTLTPPGGADAVAWALADSNGVASVPFALTANGVQSITASYAGNTCLGAVTSEAGSVAAYQRTTVTLAPASGVCGAELTLHAQVLAVPQNTPVPGVVVTFSFDGVITPQLQTTASNGVASAEVLFGAASAGYTARAVFSVGELYFTDASGSLPSASPADEISAPVTLAATTLETLSVAAYAMVADNLTVSTMLTRSDAPVSVVAGAEVVFTITGPIIAGVLDLSENTTVITVTATTDVYGGVTVMLPTVNRGEYKVSAAYAGSSCLTSAASNEASVSVYQRTKVELSAVSTACGTSVELVAALTTVPPGLILSSHEINFDFNEVLPMGSAITDEAGVARYVVAFPASGTFSVSARFYRPTHYHTDEEGAVPPVPELGTANAVVASAATELAPVEINTGQIFAFSPLFAWTTLVRTSEPAGALEGKSVLFTLLKPDGTTATNSSLTNATGYAQAEFDGTEVFTAGTFNVSASFAGDSCHAAYDTLESGSGGVGALVMQRTALSLSSNKGQCGNAMPLTATLRAVPQGVPVVGMSVSFSGAGVSCNSFTDSNGVATCAHAFSAAQQAPVLASFAPDSPASTYVASAAASTAVVGMTPTTIVYTGRTSAVSGQAAPHAVFARGEVATLSARITRKVGGTPVVGRQVTLSIGTGSNVQSCTSSSDSNGDVSCSTTSPVEQQLGPLRPISMTFAGDSCFSPSRGAATALVFAFAVDNAAFATGDLVTAPTRTFLHPQWTAKNAMSTPLDGDTAFQGFGTDPRTTSQCGGALTIVDADALPSHVPEFMGVLRVSSASGSTLNAAAIDIVHVAQDAYCNGRADAVDDSDFVSWVLNGLKPTTGTATDDVQSRCTGQRVIKGAGTFIATYCP